MVTFPPVKNLDEGGDFLSLFVADHIIQKSEQMRDRNLQYNVCLDDKSVATVVEVALHEVLVLRMVLKLGTTVQLLV